MSKETKSSNLLLWTRLPHVLLQVLVDTVDYLTVRGADLPPQHTLDLHVSGVTKQANLMGHLACSSCTSNSTLPNLNVQVNPPLCVNSSSSSFSLETNVASSPQR